MEIQYLWFCHTCGMLFHTDDQEGDVAFCAAPCERVFRDESIYSITGGVDADYMRGLAWMPSLRG